MEIVVYTWIGLLAIHLLDESISAYRGEKSYLLKLGEKIL